MKKESFTLFMKQVAVDLQQSGNLGTAHVYRSTLNAILTFQGSDRLSFREITPEWLKQFCGKSVQEWKKRVCFMRLQSFRDRKSVV